MGNWPSNAGPSSEIQDAVNAAENILHVSGKVGFSVSLLHSPPQEIFRNSGAAPAAVNFDAAGAKIESGDTAGEHAFCGSMTLGAMDDGADRVICGFHYVEGADVGAAAYDEPVIGIASSGSPDATGQDIAIFNPGAGQTTSGNIRVDDSGVDTDGTITYPNMNRQHWMEVVVDYADTETRFYIDNSELTGSEDGAIGTLAAVPPLSSALSVGAGCVGTNNSFFRILHMTTIIDLGV